MTTELAIRPDQTGFDETQQAALQALGIDKAPKGDQQLFLHVAQRSGLDPWAKQIYLIPRWDGKENKQKWTIQTSIDGLRVIRDRIGTFQGLTTEWCGPDGVWKDVWLSDKAPAAARVSVYVKGFQVPVRGIALWREYVQTTKGGTVTAMWDTKRSVMIAKCAEAIAYRQAFPQDFSGLYVQEEMPQGDQSAALVQARQQHEGGAVASDADVTDRWRGLVTDATMVGELAALWSQAQAEHALNLTVDGRPLGDHLREKKARLVAAAEAEEARAVQDATEQPELLDDDEDGVPF